MRTERERRTNRKREIGANREREKDKQRKRDGGGNMKKEMETIFCNFRG